MLAQLIRFAGVGGLATLAHVLCALLVQWMLSLSAQQANLAGFGAGVLVSYAGHARITFGMPLKSAPQILRFLVLSLLSLGASSGTVWLMTDRLGFGFPAAMLAVSVIVPVVSYLVMRFWVFAEGGRVGSGNLTGLALSLALAVALLALMWGRMVNHDSAWYLFATRDWLGGARLYEDLVEVNPPLNFYLTVPALLIADLLAISDTNGFYVAVSLLLFVSLSWCSAILWADFSQSRRSRVLLVALAAATLAALNNFGQREHILVLFLLPWALREASTAPALLRQRVASAAFAAAGICLKPHFVLLPLAVTLLNCLQTRSLRPVFSVANLTFLAVGTAYLGFVRAAHPAYFHDIIPISLEVYGSYRGSFIEILSKLRLAEVLVALQVVHILLAPGRDRLASVFAALSAGGLGVYFLQSTGFEYHKIPFLVFGVTVSIVILMQAKPRRRDKIAAAIAVAGLVGIGLRLGFYQNVAVPEVTRVVGDIRPQGVTVISSYVHAGPPVAVALETDWVSRYPTNWLVPGPINRLAGIDCATVPALCERLQAIANRNRADIILEMQKREPELLIVDRSPGYFDVPDFDWLSFMAADPNWAKTFADYRQIAMTDRFIYFLRRP